MSNEEKILALLEEVKRNTLLAAKQMLTIEDVMLITGFSKQYIYGMTCKKKIPFYRPQGKTVYFDRDELFAWMRQNRVTPEYETDAQSILKSYVNS